MTEHKHQWIKWDVVKLPWGKGVTSHCITCSKQRYTDGTIVVYSKDK